MITMPIEKAQASFVQLCHELAESGETCMIEEGGKPLVRMVPEPSVSAGQGLRRSIMEDLAEWDRTHGLLPDDVPDFPDVWLERTAGLLPLAATAWEADWNTPEEDAAWRDL